MNRNLHPLVAAVLISAGVIGSVGPLPAQVKVIANHSVRADTITLAELRSVFLEERRSLSDGSHVEPVLTRDGSAHEAFLKEYLGKTDDALQNYYRTLVFTGTGLMPKILHSDLEVISYVSKTRGAIGYVDGGAEVGDLKVLTILRGENSGGRKLLTRIDPIYPETLRRMQIGGTVRLAVTISPKGSVDEVKVLGGNPILAEAAVNAVQQWVYSPKSSRTTQNITIPFVP